MGTWCYCRSGSQKRPLEEMASDQEPEWWEVEVLRGHLPTRGLSSIHSVVFDSLRPHGLQHARLPCPSPTPRAYSNSCPLSQWCHPSISSSVIPFCSHVWSFPASGSFPMSHIWWPKYWSFSFSISPSNEYSPADFLLDWLVWTRSNERTGKC